MRWIWMERGDYLFCRIGELASAKKTLSNEGFIAKAAPEVVAKKRERAEELEAEIAALTAQLADFA